VLGIPSGPGVFFLGRVFIMDLTLLGVIGCIVGGLGQGSLVSP